MQGASWRAGDNSQTALGFAVRRCGAWTPALLPPSCVTLSECLPLSASGRPHSEMWAPPPPEVPDARPSHPPRLPTGHSPVMRTSAERQAKAGTSTTRPCRDREKARMLSIQSPKPRAHCSRWSTRPEQKMSFPSAGFELAGREDADVGQGGGGARGQGSRRGAERAEVTHR